MLGWDPYIGAAMLCGYFDESNQHELVNNQMVRMTMGGCISTKDKWKHLSAEWAGVLSEFDVPMFHMTDFETDHGEFEGWKSNRRADREPLLNKLLDLMINHVELYLGTFVEVAILGKEEKNHYENLVRNTVDSAASMHQLGGGKMAIVLARHDYFSAPKAEELSAELEAGNHPNIGPVTVAEPLCIYPLQAADIFAYELSRHMRFNGVLRYPFKRIVENAANGGAKIVTHLYRASFRFDPRKSGDALPGTILPFPKEKD